jgi:hypothetical protein
MDWDESLNRPMRWTYWDGKNVNGWPHGKWVLWEEHEASKEKTTIMEEWWNMGKCLGGKFYKENGDVFLYGPNRGQNITLIGCG